ncbi:MAG: YibE/F family protein [Candidatus Paceibacterota bacterium]
MTFNQEIIAAEIARIIVGSMGVILAVPLTTIIAAWWFGTHGVRDKDLRTHTHHH